MRVDGQVLFRHLRADRGAPDAGPGQKQALQAGEFFPVQFLRGAVGVEGEGGAVVKLLVFEVVLVRDDGDAESAQVTDILAQGEFAIDAGGLAAFEDVRDKPVVLVDQLARQLFEAGAVVVGPPGVEVAGAVVTRALVVEAVADLVADDGADRPEIFRGVGVDVEERRAQDRGCLLYTSDAADE